MAVRVDPGRFVAYGAGEKVDLELRCKACGDSLCDIEDGDSLGVLLGVALAHPCPVDDEADRGACRVCGCTDDTACDPPCSWAGPGLCTSCDGGVL